MVLFLSLGACGLLFPVRHWLSSAGCGRLRAGMSVAAGIGTRLVNGVTVVPVAGGALRVGTNDAVDGGALAGILCGGVFAGALEPVLC